MKSITELREKLYRRQEMLENMLSYTYRDIKDMYDDINEYHEDIGYHKGFIKALTTAIHTLDEENKDKWDKEMKFQSKLLDAIIEKACK